MSRNVALKNLAERYTIKHTFDTRWLCVTRKSVISLLDLFEEKNISKYKIPTISVFSCRFHFIIIVIIITIIIPWFVRSACVRACAGSCAYASVSMLQFILHETPVHSHTHTHSHSLTRAPSCICRFIHATHELISNSFTINVYFTVWVALPWACV